MNKKILLLIGTLSFLSFAQESATAVDGSSTNKIANINKRNIALHSSANFDTTTAANSSNSANISLGAEYFFADKVSAGLGFHYSLDSGKSVSTIGPGASYYFWTDEKIATYVQAGIKFGLTNATVKNFIFGDLGANYFITPEVAIGPSLYLERVHGHYSDWNDYGMAVNFSIYL